MQLPAEIFDAITSFVEDIPIQDDRLVIRYADRYNPEAANRLKVLRLVNQAFYASATPRLFRIVDALCKSALSRSLSRLSAISSSYCGEHVRNLRIGFTGPRTSHGTFEEYIQRMADLPECFSRLPTLTTLTIEASSHEDGTACSYVPPLHMEPFCNAAANILRNAHLPNVVDLTLSLPLTASFRPFSADVFRQLQHLCVQVNDNTGPGGERYMKWPISEAKYTLPMQEHAGDLFALIEQTEDLSSLQIRSTDILNLDNLCFSKQNQLTTLLLSHISISSSHLLRLINQCHPTLGRLEFHRVELNSGTWADMLSHICQLPRLHYFYIESSGYSRTGASSSLCLGLSPLFDDRRDIETCNPLDYNAYGDVQRQVNANRVARGLDPIGVFEYRRTGMRSLEEAIKRRSLL